VASNNEVERGQRVERSDGSLSLASQHKHLRLRLHVPGDEALPSRSESNRLQRMPLQNNGSVKIERNGMGEAHLHAAA
jgi:hypothetical protein